MAARYTLILGTKEWSSWSLRPYVALRAVGAPFAEDVIALRRHSTSEEVLKRTPAGRVPVLKIEENGKSTIVWDSLAICETLAERHPEARLWPDDSAVRAQARSYAAEMHSGFSDVRDQLSMDFARTLPSPELRDNTKAQIARILTAWSEALGKYGKDGGFLFGHFSVVDCMYAPVVSRFKTYGIEVPPSVKTYMERIFALPAMQDWGKAAKAEVEAGLA
ncbi:MAG: glutathione S-transferase [Proteobacteria bacterium]|nr:glutathione S-transferase [Pseudomonadota bacterium]